MEPLAADEHTPTFHSRHTLAQKAILALNIVVVLACVFGAGGLLYAKGLLDRRLQTEKFSVATTVEGKPAPPGSTLVGDTTPTSSGSTFPPADPKAQNFLITGEDNRPCVDPNSQWSGAADPSRVNIGQRSDTIMVMRVDPVSNRAAVLSFPRDLWIKIPGRSTNRINTAYVRGDYSLLAKTLYNNFGVVVDHYLQVDFCAFKRIVDAVGGVAVPFKTPILDANVGISLQSGCHTFHGDEALAYVRSRHLKWVDANGGVHEDRAGDFGRIARQQDFLRRVLQSALKKGLFDPKIASALITTLQKEIVTEKGFSVNDMLKFAGVLHNVQPGSIQTYQIESSGTNIGGNAVRLPNIGGPNMKAILQIFQGRAPLAGATDQVFDGTTSSTPTGTVAGGDTTSSNTSTTADATTTTTKKATTTTVGAQSNNQGDIIPDKNVVC
jgi:LCP family protein required for cell wall assembly